MLHPDYPVWSFIGFVLVLLPVPWHWRARNVATLSLCFWIAVTNLIFFVNTLVWADNYRNVSPIWCDISGRIIRMISYAIPACSLSQMHRLESVASTRRSVISANERTRRMWTEAIACILFPIVMSALLSIVQGHRYDIIENFGPSVSIYNSWPGLVLAFFVPFSISLASVVYAALAVRWFLVRRLQFRAILASSNTGLNSSRYLRLIALAIADVSLIVIYHIVVLATTLSAGPVMPYHSWSEVHRQFGYVNQIPEAIQEPINYAASVFGLYNGPLCSIFFFLFFGLGEEAISEYSRVLDKVIVMTGRLGLSKSTTSMRTDIIHVPRNPTLGSKTVPASERAWRDNTSEINDGAGTLFQPANSDNVQQIGKTGIPILIERSVV